ALIKSVETLHKWRASLLNEALQQYLEANGGKYPTDILQLKDMPALKSYETGSISRLIAGAQRYSFAMGHKGIDEDVLSNFVQPDLLLLNTPVTDIFPTGTKMSEVQNTIFKDSLTSGSGIPV